MLSPRHASASIGPMVSSARSRPSMLQCRSETIPSFNKGLSVDWRALSSRGQKQAGQRGGPLSLATRSALLFSVRRRFAPTHRLQDSNEDQRCDRPMEPDPVKTGENIDHDQKGRNCEEHCRETRQVREPVRDDAYRRGWLVSVAKPLSAGFRGCARFRLGRGPFVDCEAAAADGSAAHGHSIADHGGNVLHLLLAETVETKG